jgi:hypothetical protein
MYGFRRDAQLQATACQHKLLTESICTLHDVMEITNGQPWQNSVFWREAKYHCQVVHFLLHEYKRMIKIKFRASNTL